MATALGAASFQRSITSFGTERLLIALWGLGAGIGILAKPRITVFDLVSIILVAVNVRRLFEAGAARISISAAILTSVMAVSVLAGYSEPEDAIWRLGGYLLLLIDALALFFVFRGSDIAEINLFLFYLAIGSCLEILRPEDERMVTEPIKFLLNTPLGIIVAYLLGCTDRVWRRLAVALGLSAYGLYCFKIGARNAGGVELAAVLLAISPVPRFFRQPKFYHYPLFYVLSMVSGAALVWVYTKLAVEGYLGRTSEMIAKAQSAYFNGIGGLLLGGRPQIYSLFEGFLGSPWLGAGIGKHSYSQVLLLVLDNRVNAGALYDPNLPTLHSMALGAALEIGVFGALVWFYWIHMSVRGIFTIYRTKPAGMEIIALLLIQAVWNIAFSPLVGVTRMVTAPAIFLAAYLAVREAMAQRSSAVLNERLVAHVAE